MEKKNLLILDGDKCFGEYVQTIAKSEGYYANYTDNLTDFLKSYQLTLPDLIILDLTINEIDGIKILQILQDMHTRCPIVIISELNPAVLSCAHRLGLLYGLRMLPTLTKPIDKDLFINLLQKIKKSQIFTREDIKNALEKKQFYVHYLPKFSLIDKRIVGAEALVRWKMKGEIFYPNNFIALVEEHNLIKELTLLVLNDVLKSYNSIKNEYENFLVSINLSGKLLGQFQLADEFESLTKQYKVSPTNISFEIAESNVMRQPVIAMEMMTKLREKKFYLALDNFGTGFSSLPTLYRMPFHELKIDRALITTLASDTSLRGLTQGIINLAKGFGYKVTAEGVEHQEILKMLATFHCDFAQGYYICPPLAAEDFVRWLEQQHLLETAHSILG